MQPCHYGAVNWPALARAIVARRVELGHDTQKAFAEASEISLRTISDLEAGDRDRYTPSTLARLEKALRWPTGRVGEILSQPTSSFVAVEGPAPGTYIIGPQDVMAAVGGKPVPLVIQAPPPDVTTDGLVPPAAIGKPELSTPEGIARYLHRDDLPLVALLHRAGLAEADLFRLILHVRAVRERQNAVLLDDLAQRIRDLGGWAPDQPYPPTWLMEGNDER